MAEPAADPNETLKQALANPEEVRKLNLRAYISPSADGATGSERRLAAVPAEIARLVHLEELDLSGNRLPRLPEEVGKLRRLKRLKLSSNRLAELPAGLFMLSELEELDLRSNPIAVLPADIGELQSLRRLVLAQTPIKALPPEIAKLGRLEELDLYATDIVAFPAVLAKLPRLTTLDLSGTRITRRWLQAVSEYPPKLMVLKLNHTDASPGWMKYFESIKNLQRLELIFTPCSPFDIEEMRKRRPAVEMVSGKYSDLFHTTHLRDPERVTSLDFTRVGLSTLPAEIKQFVNLKEIRLDDNQFTEIPSELFALPKLEAIALNNNRIRAVPRDILALQQLVELDLENNELTAIPEVVLELPRFAYLVLGGNKIDRLPRDLSKLDKLKSLKLEGNRLTRAEFAELKRKLPPDLTRSWDFRGGDDFDLPIYSWADALKDPERVYALDLSQQNLRELPAGIEKLVSLEILHLEGNPIASLPEAIGKLKNLQVIYATDTGLDAGDAQALARLLPKAKLIYDTPSAP